MKSWGMIICEHPRRPAVRKSEMRNSDEGGVSIRTYAFTLHPWDYHYL